MEGRLERAANGFLDILTSRIFLIVMTLGVAYCTSSFAFDYGSNFDPRYSYLFAIALFSLTFFYAKKLPGWLLKGMSAIATVGLLVFTIFVSSAAWLNAGTNKADPEIAVIRDTIDDLKDQISARNLEIATLLATQNPWNARKVGDQKAVLEEKLSNARERLAKLESKNGRFESGAMAVFGYLSKLTGKPVEIVTLITMWCLTFILVCMEVSLGAAATMTSRPVKQVKSESNDWAERPVSVLNGPNSTETSTKRDSVPPNRTGTTSDKYRTKMRTAIINRSVPNLKYDTLVEKCGGSKNTAKQVLEELEGRVVARNGRSWDWLSEVKHG